MAAAVDSVAAVVVAESAIAGKRFTPIEQAKGAMKAWHPFFVWFSQIHPQKKDQTVKKMNRVTSRWIRGVSGIAVFYCRELIETTAS